MKNTILNFPTDIPVIVDDGELKVRGIIKSTYKQKLLVEINADNAPMYFSLDAVEAAVQGFDLEEFPSSKRYVPFDIDEKLIVTPIESKL